MHIVLLSSCVFTRLMLKQCPERTCSFGGCQSRLAKEPTRPFTETTIWRGKINDKNLGKEAVVNVVRPAAPNRQVKRNIIE